MSPSSREQSIGSSNFSGGMSNSRFIDNDDDCN